jgi:4-amino-4-deoxy-L-arabinose transferase-like glycosyltransferase
MPLKKTISGFSAVTTSRSGRLAALVLVILAGFALRLFQLNEMSLRGDETFTVMHWMREPLAQTLAEIRTIDPQPPLAYAIFHVYGMLAGTQEHIVRFLPALLNTLGIAAAYGAGRRLVGARAGLALAGMYAAAPHILWHAQDARNYSLWSAASLIALWLALRALQRNRRLDYVLYVTAASVACYLYYLELFFVAALNVYAIAAYWRKWSVWRRWFAAQAALGALLAVWFLQPDLLSGGGYGGTAGQLDIARYFTWFVPELLFGNTLPPALLGIGAVLGCVLIAAGIGVLIHENRRAALLVSVSIVLPAVLLGVVATRINVFVPRYILAAAPFMMLAVIALVGWLLAHRRAALRLLGAASAILIVSLAGTSLLIDYSDYTKSPQWRELSGALARLDSTQAIIVNQSADVALSFYLAEYGAQAEEFYLPASPRQPAAEIESILQAQIDAGLRILTVTSPNADWPNADVPEAVLETNAVLLWSRTIAGQPAAMWAPPLDAAAQDDPLAVFGDVVALESWDVLPASPDDPFIVLTTVWRPLENTDAPVKFFAHVLGDVNPVTGTPLWAQSDVLPADGALSSVDWDDAGRFYQVFAIPAGSLPDGAYQLTLGVYSEGTGTRLTTGGDDALTLYTFTK